MNDYIGTIYNNLVKGEPVQRALSIIHSSVGFTTGHSKNWRYFRVKNLVVWNEPPTEEDKVNVVEFLLKRGIENASHKNMYDRN